MQRPLEFQSRAEARRVKELLAALRTEVRIEVNPDSDLLMPAFEEEFRSRLLAQHIFLGEPMFQQSFDNAFIASCVAAGQSVESAIDGQRFWDVAIAGKKVSLKSSKAKSLKSHKLHISKLTEAAWIQDCRTSRHRQDKTFDLFQTYIGMVDRIFQFRYFSTTNLYELVEIPVALFQHVFEVPLHYFDSDGPTINIPVGFEQPYFTLKIDRSDAKITIANIDKARCVVHASWQLPQP